MALSQCLDESPLRPGPGGPRPAGAGELDLQEVYDERHRLALEQLLSGGPAAFTGFLRAERIPNFLSDEELQRLGGAAVPPAGASLLGEDLETSLRGSLDCSSVTYFPEMSDLEPPELELGWPAFTAGSYRGVTRALAHFQPGHGDSIYRCKEAARRMIRSAREVIAIVTDSLTDLDIFKDLQEACSRRRVPVYILLDQASAPGFLKMCRNVDVRLDDLQDMRVRTITGTTYYTRSGARITGKVHERFMLIDGNRVATGSYRFNWTDGKLNSSNLIELSGQITEKFDEEFRILYAQSQPVTPGAVLEQLLLQQAPSPAPRAAPSPRVPPSPAPRAAPSPAPRAPPSPRTPRPAQPACLTSTPTRTPRPAQLTSTPTRTPRPAQLTSTPTRTPRASVLQAGREVGAPGTPGAGGAGPGSGPCSEDGDWAVQPLQEEILAGSPTLQVSAEQLAEDDAPATPDPVSRHAWTQTSWSGTDGSAQTDLSPGPVQEGSPGPARVRRSPPGPGPADAPLQESFHKLSRERQHHYSAIRSKLEHMVDTMSRRRQLADVTNLSPGLGAGGRPRTHKDPGQEPGPRLPVDGLGTGTWPRARCVH
ncbi:protein FAM83D [Cololabis saira]|uniref:protein FAM83D n=1 Tax=Cololabis saira TaxID=129043 RepID=UPI002AD430A1|nr:protein FAM83D [Cololabis saira]